MKRILIIFLILFCSCIFIKSAQAWQLIDWEKFEKKTGWNQEEVLLEGMIAGLHIADWIQTLKLSRNLGEYYERNPVIGKHPSKGRVNTCMGLFLAGKIIVPHYLPRDYNLWGWKIKPRKIFQYVTIGVSGYNVGRNYSIGLRFGF